MKELVSTTSPFNVIEFVVKKIIPQIFNKMNKQNEEKEKYLNSSLSLLESLCLSGNHLILQETIPKISILIEIYFSGISFHQNII